MLDEFTKVTDELFRKFHLLLGNTEDAQDALQDAFLDCWKAREMLPKLRNPRAWIWHVGLNAARDFGDRQRRRRMQPLSCVEATAASSEASASDHLLHQEEEELLHDALVRLRPEEREVFRLRQEEALTYDEIARRRSVPSGTVKTQMRPAVSKLKRMLQTTEQ